VAAAVVVAAVVAEEGTVVVAGAAAAGGDREARTMLTYLKPFACGIALGLVSLVLAPLHAGAAETTEQTKFARPEDAMRALVAAVRADDHAKTIAILGPGSEEVISSGDPVDDKAAGRRFVTAATERTQIETLPSGATIAHLGKDDWPFPIPLVKDGSEWRFDTAAGREELLNRRIGRNELKAVAVCHAYVQAQYEYASKDRTGGGRAYAQKVRSDPGKKDGLYWEDPTSAHPSPLGPLVAEAEGEGYGLRQPGAAPRPYHGYVYRILTAQGLHAAGGARRYVRDGRMTGGFALIAVPAEYGSSGVMTFLVGPLGIVYQKNLGEKTAEAAAAITAYDPDESWIPIRD